MKTIKNIIYKILPVLVLVFLWVACKDDEMDTLNLSRQFKPSAFNIDEGETSVLIQWNSSLFTLPGEVQYAVEISKNIDFSTVEFTSTQGVNQLNLLDTDLVVRQDYYVRVKAIGSGTVNDSNWLISDKFRITGEIFILPVKEADVVTDAAYIHWKVSPGLGKLVFTSASGIIEAEITEEEAAAGVKLVEGLDGGTAYTAELFNLDGVPKGTATFNTKPSYEGSNIIDLRVINIADRPNVLADTLGKIESGSVILLKRGVTYTIPAGENLDRSVTITSGADFIEELASVFMSANFNLVAASQIDSLVFRDLNMYSDNYDGKYIFNINQIGTIGKVRFDNVRGHKFRGFFRLQTGTTGTQVDQLYVNNCVIDSLRDFSLVNTNNSNTVANIKVTNTTLYNARKVIDHRSPGSNTMVFENCTFNNLPTGGAVGAGTFYFIDLNTFDVANPIVITNCLFGKTRDEGMGGNDAKGIRAGAATSVSVTNSYNTSDFICTTFPISGLIPYQGTSYNLYTDPDNGNFKIKDAGFGGKTSTGDPRWR